MEVGAGEWMDANLSPAPSSLQNKENKEAGGTDTSTPPRPRPCLNVHLN